MFELLFHFCCDLMQGLGNMFGLSYQTINVFLFCFVEPIFTGIMFILAIISLYKIPVKKVGTWFFRIVVVSVILLLLLGGFYFVPQRITYYNGYTSEPFINSYVPHSVYVDKLFDGTVDWLEDLGNKTGLSYYVINIIVYIMFMPAVSIGSYIVLRLNGKRREAN